MGSKKCTHYWIIETAAGPISNGACSSCGMKKSFRNSIGDEGLHTQSYPPQNSGSKDNSYGYFQVKNSTRNKTARTGISLHKTSEYKRA